MPQYRFFIETSLYDREVVFIEDAEYHHMTKVMRLRQGDVVELVDGQGHLAKAVIGYLEKEKAKCIIQHTTFQKAPFYPFVIAQSILKPSLLELSVEKNTELGTSGIWMFPAMHSEKTHLPEHLTQRLYKHTVSALKQCGRLYLPEMKYFTSLEEILKTSQPLLLYGDTSLTAPHISSVPRKQDQRVTFFVGPERGFDPKEIDLLKSYGAQGVSLHMNILRAETASIAASALLSRA